MIINLNDYLAKVTIPSYKDMAEGSAQGHVRLKHDDRAVTVMTVGGYMTGTTWESGYSSVSMGVLAAASHNKGLNFLQLYAVLLRDHGFPDDLTVMKRVASDLDVFRGMGALTFYEGGCDIALPPGEVSGFSSVLMQGIGSSRVIYSDRENMAGIEVVSSTPRIGNLGKVVGTQFAKYFPLIDPVSSVREVVAPAELGAVFAAFGRR